MRARGLIAAIATVAIAAIALGRTAAAQSSGAADPTLGNLPPIAARSITSSRNLWYAVTYDLPSGKRIFSKLSYGIEAGWSARFCGTLRERPIQSVSGGHTVLLPSGSGQKDAVAYGETGTPLLPPAPTVVGRSERTWCGSLSTGTGERQRVTEILVAAANAMISDVKIVVRVDPGVKILRESWGTGGVAMVTDADFQGGQRIVAGGRAAPEDWNTPLATADANASAAREHQRTYKRSANAWFNAGRTYAGTAPVTYGGYVNPAAWLSVKGPGRPIGTFRGDPLSGDDDVTHTIGTTYFTGLERGRYVYRIEAMAAAYEKTSPGHLALGGAQAAMLSQAGTQPWAFLVSADADMPPCASSVVQWKEPSGSKVCGPGPWRMKRGLAL